MVRSKRKNSAYSLALRQVQSSRQEEQSNQPAAESTSMTDRTQKPEELQAFQTAEHPDSKTAKQPRIKATFYLSPDDIVAIDTMQTKEFQQSGKKPEKSVLVSQAVQLLFRQQNN